MYKYVLVAALLLTVVLPSDPSRAADRNSGKPTVKLTPVAPGVLYIQYKPGSKAMQAIRGKTGSSIQSITDSRYERIVRQLGVTLIEPFDKNATDAIALSLGIDRIYRVYYANHAIDPHAAILQLLATDEVEAASSQYLFPFSFRPNDPNVSQQYALTKMSMFNAWDITRGDSNIIIADVDAATNIDHEDLVGEVKYNAGEVGTDAKGNDKRTNGIDDDGDGYVDNYQGWDIVGTATLGTPFRPDNNPRPDNSNVNHGTLTAGCILATGNNGKGVAGVADGCRMLPIKASSNPLYIMGGYEGIHYAVNHGAKVVNCSWGGPVASTEVTLANVFLKEATTRNALVVCASGNEGKNLDYSPDYPANGPGVLSVGATTSSDGAASFGNYGHSVSVFAPGAGILSTDYPGNAAYAPEDGTSFSSPLTAGVAGLVFSQHPTWMPQFVARQIIQTADNVVSPTDRYSYWGRVNAEKALSTSQWPGFIATQWTISGQTNDSLDFPGIEQDLNVTLKNVVANGANIMARLVPNEGYTTTSAPVSLGAVAVNSTALTSFKITRTDEFTSGNLPIKIFLSDQGSLADTITIYIPMKRIKGFTTVERVIYGSSVKRVNNQTAWASFGLEQSGMVIAAQYAAQTVGLWDTTYVLDDGSVAPYCVEATDDMHAWFGTGSSASQSSVISTDDAGGSFTSVSTSTITPFVNTIHFFDATHGIFIGDPLASKWGIGITTDGGQKWTKLAKTITAPTSEASWNNATAWVGQNGWFGTNKNHIWHTTDGGQTWKSTTVPQPNSLGIGFAADATHGFACCRPAAQSGSQTLSGVNALLYTSDGGAKWVEIARPDTTSPGTVHFVPDTTIAIMTSSSGVYRTDDFGNTWSRIPMPITFDATGADLDISRDNDSVVITVLSSGTGLMSYSMPMTPPTRDVKPERAGLSLELEANVPNPAHSSTEITFSHPRTEHITLTVIDALGREVATLVDADRPAGQESVRLNTEKLTPGSYFYVLQSESGERITRTMTVTR